MSKDKKPPRSGDELRKQAVFEYEIKSAPALALLDIACAALDQAVQAEALIAAEGLCVPGSRGPRPHPAAAIARDARNRMIASLRALHLDL